MRSNELSVIFEKAVGVFILTFSNYFVHPVGRLVRNEYLIIFMEFAIFINQL